MSTFYAFELIFLSVFDNFKGNYTSFKDSTWSHSFTKRSSFLQIPDFIDAIINLIKDGFLHWAGIWNKVWACNNRRALSITGETIKPNSRPKIDIQLKTLPMMYPKSNRYIVAIYKL